MKKIEYAIKNFLIMIVIAMFLVSTIIPIVTARNESYKPFEKGIPWQPFVPLKRTTFVGFDKESYVDDYAYLASIPANVFSDGETMFANPLLFFQPKDTYDHNFPDDN
jgi:hypothetical protein